MHVKLPESTYDAVYQRARAERVSIPEIDPAAWSLQPLLPID